ncbi:MAG: ABC transporter permease [Dongiaceae bacterium]
MAEAGGRARARLWFGAGVTGLLLAVAAAAPLLSPHDPLAQDLLNAQLPPFWAEGADPAFPLGTDSLGRDLLARLVYGARIALVVAVLAASLAALLGTALGLAAGYLGGWVDQLVSRLVDIWMSFPPVLLSIVLVAVIGAGLPAVITAIVIVDWTRFCRVVRAEVMAQKGRDYVDAAIVLGVGRGAILRREILPNLLPLIAVLLGLEMGVAVTVEAILSFVGLGIASDAPSWGGLIAEGRSTVYQAWWVMAMPMACIVLVVLGFNALSDGLRERFDPLLRR